MAYKITEDKEKQEIYIDLDPAIDQRLCQDPGDGLVGKNSIIQMDLDPITGAISGLRICFEPGRDDSAFEIPIDKR